MSASFEFDDLDALIAATVGPKGERVFYVQARHAGQVVAFKVEKLQIAALAEYLNQLMADLPPTVDGPPAIVDELVTPVMAEWVVGNIGVAYEPEDDRFVILAEEMVSDDMTDDDASSARFRISRLQAETFVEQASELVAAGRGPCPFCGLAPIGTGSWCPCQN